MSETYEEAERELNAHQQRMQEARNDYGPLDLMDCIKKMDEMRVAKDQTESALKEINARYDVLRFEIIPSKMEEQGVERMNVTGIGRINLTGDMNVRVIDTQGFFKWLNVHNLGDIVKPTVAPSTLKAFVKGRIKSGKEVPQEFVKVHPFTRASITKG